MGTLEALWEGRGDMIRTVFGKTSPQQQLGSHFHLPGRGQGDLAQGIDGSRNKRTAQCVLFLTKLVVLPSRPVSTFGSKNTYFGEKWER